jgi:hypothetical protein
MSEQENKALHFAVIAEKSGYPEPLYLHSLTFARLVDDVVVPLESGESFFVDGVSVAKDNLLRMKIVRQLPIFDHDFKELHYFIQQPSSKKFVQAKEYPTRLDALFRGAGEDVTRQVLNAFKACIQPRIGEYPPRRDELIASALSVFVSTTKALGNVEGA